MRHRGALCHDDVPFGVSLCLHTRSPCGYAGSMAKRHFRCPARPFTVFHNFLCPSPRLAPLAGLANSCFRAPCLLPLSFRPPSLSRRSHKALHDLPCRRDDDGPEPSGRADEGLTEADKSRSRGRTLRSTIVVEDRKEGDREGDGGGRSRDRERERERDRERDRGGERGASGRGEERGGRDEGRSSRGEDRSGRGEDRRRSGPEDAGRRGRSTSRERARSVGRSRSRDKRQRR